MKLSHLLWSLAVMTTTSFAANAASPENTLNLDMKSGRVVIELLPDVAPGHVERIKTLVNEGFYDGIVFHRVIDGFMAQTGDPTGTGRGGSSYPDLKAEFSNTPYKRGTLGMARTMNPDSANSQFFICFTDDGCSFLTGQYTVFGQVVSGMEFVDGIAKGEPPANPDKIVKASLGAAAATAATPAADAAAKTEPAAKEEAAKEAPKAAAEPEAAADHEEEAAH
jgi:peptidylprolyl isomerase